MNQRVLFVDDEQHVLDGLRRTLRKECEVHTCANPIEGLAMLSEQDPFAIVVSDMRMPQMDGVQFLLRAQQHAPDTVRIMLTGNADQQTAMDAVNTGKVFRFLTKPCDAQTLRQVVALGLRQHELVTAERTLLERTVRGSVKVLADILALSRPEAFGRVNRLRELASGAGKHLDGIESWELDTAALLCLVGCVNIDALTLERVQRGEPLGPKEASEFQYHPVLGAELIGAIPRLEHVAEIVKYQHKHFDGSGIPFDDRRGEDLPLGARILHVVLAYDEQKRADVSDAQALAFLRNGPERFDADVVKAFAAEIETNEPAETLRLRPNQLVSGMIIQEDVKCDGGILLVCQGQVTTPAVIKHLQRFHSLERLSNAMILITKGSVANI
jgi:response regulator RpfG family c-di-GMP phosphodiesterase